MRERTRFGWKKSIFTDVTLVYQDDRVNGRTGRESIFTDVTLAYQDDRENRRRGRERFQMVWSQAKTTAKVWWIAALGRCGRFSIVVMVLSKSNRQNGGKKFRFLHKDLLS